MSAHRQRKGGKGAGGKGWRHNNNSSRGNWNDDEERFRSGGLSWNEMGFKVERHKRTVHYLTDADLGCAIQSYEAALKKRELEADAQKAFQMAALIKGMLHSSRLS